MTISPACNAHTCAQYEKNNPTNQFFRFPLPPFNTRTRGEEGVLNRIEHGTKTTPSRHKTKLKFMAGKKKKNPFRLADEWWDDDLRITSNRFLETAKNVPTG